MQMIKADWPLAFNTFINEELIPLFDRNFFNYWVYPAYDRAVGIIMRCAFHMKKHFIHVAEMAADMDGGEKN